jgi:hypothetical protein
MILKRKALRFYSRFSGRSIGFLLFGILFLYFGISYLPIVLTSKSSLIPLKGTIRSANIYVNTVESKGSKSQKSEMVFYLNEFDQKFYLVENIGNRSINERYVEILNELRQARFVVIWIKKAEAEEKEPKVYQIETNPHNILLDLESVISEDKTSTYFFLLMGLGFMVFGLWPLYPENFKDFWKY